MEFTGRFEELKKDILKNSLMITFTVNEPDAVSQIESIKDCERLTVKAVKFRKKRSLDANAYAWLLMSKIAAAMNTSKEEVYEEMLRRYGQIFEDEDGVITITVKNSVDMSKIDGHWYKLKGNDRFTAYAMIKGSSEYDTKEMTVFIDGIVSEAKELGIETMTPDEIERMKQEWHLKV